jgi:Ser-tRNA(Ala) deacylase AlaX
MSDFRDLCARMADELDHYRQLLMDDRRETHALATEARAALAQSETEKAVNWSAYFARQAAAQEKELQDALAQPEPEQPSDKELDLVVIAIQALIPPQPDATTHHLSAVDRGREILRQRLARWGNL